MAQRKTLYSGPTPEDLAHIPAELKDRRQWVLWRAADKVDKRTGDVKLNKIPINPQTLHNADTTDQRTWGSFEQCIKALPVALERWEHDTPRAYRGGGLGFVFSADDPYCGIDLDRCRTPATGALEPWAQQVIDTLASYTEVTPSGAGLHTLTQGTLPPGGCRDGKVEMYDAGRFFTMTGWHVPETPCTIEVRQSQLTTVHAAYVLKPKAEAKAAKARMTQTRVSTASSLPGLSDQDILTIASRARNNAKFLALWRGDISGYTSQSEADEALLCLLAFYTRDEAQLDSLFRQSGLMDDKWDNREDYRKRTIAKALTTVTESYDPGAFLAEQAAAKGRNGHAKPPPSEPSREDTGAPGEEARAPGEPFSLPTFLAYLEALEVAQRPQAVVDTMGDLATLTTTEWMLAKQAIKKFAPDVNLNDLRTARKEIRHALKSQARADVLAALPAWQQTLFYADGGLLQETDNNLQAIFAHHPEWQERLYWDAVANRAYIDEDIPLDIHYVRNEVSPWLGQVMRMPVRHSQRVLDVMRSWAQRFARDPIQEWLQALPDTDPDDPKWILLETWLILYAGAEDSPYTRFVSRILIVSLVKRAISPGIQYRYVVVLEGEENLGKTKLLRLLGDRWHQEFSNTVQGKESYMQLQGYWLVELGELDALKPAQESRIKMFISQQMDVWVPKYENDVVERPRRAILVGTTNEREYLKGEHGNTRYLPIWLNGPIQHEAIATIRERLFVQAKHYLADHADDWWCIPPEAEDGVKHARELRKEPSIFEDTIRKGLLGRTECTIAEVLEMLSIPKDRWTKKLEMEIGKALKDLGWHKHIQWSSTDQKAVRCWKPFPQEGNVEPCPHEHVNDYGQCNDCGRALQA